MHDIINKIKQLQNKYTKHHNPSDSQSVVSALYDLQSICLKHHMNMDNYIYRNGIFNKQSAIDDIKQNIQRTKKFPSKCKPYQKELNIIKSSHQKWFDNYGIHSGAHDLIKLQLDDWKVRALLNSLLSDLYVGSYNEDTSSNLMKVSK